MIEFLGKILGLILVYLLINDYFDKKKRRELEIDEKLDKQQELLEEINEQQKKDKEE